MAIHLVERTGTARPKIPPNRPKLTARRADQVVHSGGHKPLPAFSELPYFTGFFERTRSLAERETAKLQSTGVYSCSLMYHNPLGLM